MMGKVKIGITMGDPAGIGPELCLRALREPALLSRCTPVVFGDAGVLSRVADCTGLPAPIVLFPGRSGDGMEGKTDLPLWTVK